MTQFTAVFTATWEEMDFQEATYCYVIIFQTCDKFFSFSFIFLYRIKVFKLTSVCFVKEINIFFSAFAIFKYFT